MDLNDPYIEGVDGVLVELKRRGINIHRDTLKRYRRRREMPAEKASPHPQGKLRILRSKLWSWWEALHNSTMSHP